MISLLAILELNLPLPSTLIGLLGLIAGYLFYYFSKKNKNTLNKIKSLKKDDRSEGLEMILNDSGIRIDTTGLNSKQKYDLAVRTLKGKNLNKLIAAAVTIIISITFSILLLNYKPLKNYPPVIPPTDTISYNFNSEFGELNSYIIKKLEQDSYKIDLNTPTYTISLISIPPETNLIDTLGTAQGWKHYYSQSNLKLQVNNQTPFETDLIIPKTNLVSSINEAKESYRNNLAEFMALNQEKVYNEIKKVIQN